MVIYHNCGNTATAMTDSLAFIGAMGYHFGNAVNMEDALEKMPADRLVMGNVDPAGQFRNGTTESIRKATREVMEQSAGIKVGGFCPRHHSVSKFKDKGRGMKWIAAMLTGEVAA